MTGNLTTQQVLDQTGATYRQLDDWTRKGHVTALRRTSRLGATSGSGVPRRYTPAEAAIVELMVRMVDAGVTPPAAARAARRGGILAEGVRVVLDDVPGMGANDQEDDHGWEAEQGDEGGSATQGEPGGAGLEGVEGAEGGEVEVAGGDR